MLSKGFENLTGYSIKDVVGTNCRFLQGPGTSKTAIARIRAACSLGLPAQEMLLNHRKDGTPYWVLLRIEPLRDVKGQLKYLMAHQFNCKSIPVRYGLRFVLAWLSDNIGLFTQCLDTPPISAGSCPTPLKTMALHQTPPWFKCSRREWMLQSRSI